MLVTLRLLRLKLRARVPAGKDVVGGVVNVRAETHGHFACSLGGSAVPVGVPALSASVDRLLLPS